MKLKDAQNQIKYLTRTQNELCEVFESFIQSGTEDGGQVMVDREIIKGTLSRVPRVAKTQDIGMPILSYY